LYVNDLPLISNFKIIFFGDYTVLSLSADSMYEITTKINEELESVDNWLKYDKLSLNYSKTQYMLFTKQKNLFPQISTCELTTINLQEVDASNTLGL